MNITSTEHHVLSSRWSVDGYGTTRGCRSVPVCLAGFALPMLSDCCWRAVVCGAAAVELPCCCLWSCCKGGLGPFVFTAALYRPGQRPLTADGSCKCCSMGCFTDLESAVSQTYRLSFLLEACSHVTWEARPAQKGRSLKRCTKTPMTSAVEFWSNMLQQ